MGDLLRRRDYSPLDGAAVDEEAAREHVVSLRVLARSGKLRRAGWEQQLCQLIVEGAMRRGHLLSLITPEALREVSFSAAELLNAGFSLIELREGGFTAGGLREAGMRAAELKAAAFSASELRVGGYAARELRAIGFTPAELKQGGYQARQLREIGLTAAEVRADARLPRPETCTSPLPFSPSACVLPACIAVVPPSPPHKLRPESPPRESTRAPNMQANCRQRLHHRDARACFNPPPPWCAQLGENGFSATELREGTFPLAELRRLFSANELRLAGFVAREMRDERFTIAELRAGAYSAEDLRGAGYGCSEMRSAGLSIGELRVAGYSGAGGVPHSYHTAPLRLPLINPNYPWMVYHTIASDAPPESE